MSSTPLIGTTPFSQSTIEVNNQVPEASLIQAANSGAETGSAAPPHQQSESGLVPETIPVTAQGLAGVESAKPVVILPPLGENIPAPDPVERLVSAQQYLVSPTAGSDTQEIHMITVVMRSTRDKTRDVLRMRRIHGTVMSYPGNDRFAFHVFEQGHGYLVEFPNFTTQLCPELISRLRLLVGSENVRVEAITFQ